MDTRIGKFFPIGKPAKIVTEKNTIHFRRTGKDFSTSVEMTRLHRNYKRMQQLAVRVSGMSQLTQTDRDDGSNLMKVRSASRLPESVADRGDSRSPGRA